MTSKLMSAFEIRNPFCLLIFVSVILNFMEASFVSVILCVFRALFCIQVYWQWCWLSLCSRNEQVDSGYWAKRFWAVTVVRYWGFEKHAAVSFRPIGEWCCRSKWTACPTCLGRQVWSRQWQWVRYRSWAVGSLETAFFVLECIPFFTFSFPRRDLRPLCVVYFFVFVVVCSSLSSVVYR